MSETKIKTDEVFGATEMMSGAEFTGPRETYLDLESGARATQFRFSSEKLNNEPSGGLISNISNSTSVKTFLSNTGHMEVRLVGPNSEVGGEGERSLWKNGEFQDGYKSYISVGNEEQFEDELKRLTLDEIKNRKYSNAKGDVYPAFLNMSDALPPDERDLEAEKLALALQNASTTNSSTTDSGEDDPKPNSNLKFGKVDKIIKRLSLRNLVYPIDADFGNTQDYMQINQFTYRAPNQDLFFPQSKEAKTNSKNDPGDIFTEGVQSGTPREDFLGLVKLPMPNSLADSNNVSWGADQLNALTAAVSSAVFGQTNAASQALRRLISDPPKNTPFGSNLLGKILQGGDEVSSLVKNAFGDAATEGGKVLGALDDPNSNISVLGGAVAGSALLNILQFGVSPESILARGQGVVPNNNLALLFNSPTLREFTFSWKMSPRSREEASRIRNIIRFFKQGMAPKKGFGGGTGSRSYFLGTPNVFDIIFKTTRDKYSILNENDSVLRIKTCACTGTAVNYTPDGMWNAYEQGQPVSVTLSLRFAELEPIFDTDYDENEFNYSESRPDLRPVPIDAIGY